VRGLCFYRFTKARQALNPVLAVPRGEPVVVRIPAPEEPYAVPLRSIASLMQFDPQTLYNHRVWSGAWSPMPTPDKAVGFRVRERDCACTLLNRKAWRSAPR